MSSFFSRIKSGAVSSQERPRVARARRQWLPLTRLSTATLEPSDRQHTRQEGPQRARGHAAREAAPQRRPSARRRQRQVLRLRECKSACLMPHSSKSAC
ncbi:putative ubiquitin carboxyl-terminal hydrolase [Alternaria alternata]|nr:putative ubiquitin carboxyl-terminal hydrolase [Alternaria alternata]